MQLQHAIQQLEDSINTFANITRQTAIDWEHKPAPDKWSKKEVIGHLCDSAQINLQRFIRCTYESGFKLIYHQDEWVDVQRYSDAYIDDVILLWVLLNRQIIRVLKNYPDARLAAMTDTGREEANLVGVETLAVDYVAHLKHHLKQIV